MSPRPPRGLVPLALIGWLVAIAAFAASAAPALAAGPPYPEPVDGQRVYDTAGVLSAGTIARAEQISRDIEARTGAQVVVYTQVKPESDSPELAERDAADLIDQWGIGRKGYDDGMVILFDLDRSLRHGQVQLYAGPGFEVSYLSNDDRQAIYEKDMLPLLRRGDLDGAVDVAMDRIDASATSAHADELARGRLINAIVGIILGPLLFLVIVGWAVLSWVRSGRDPVYTDDPSVLMPAPPAELSAASGALVYDGKTSRRALTTSLLDLASRGELAFEQHDGLLSKNVSIRTYGLQPTDDVDAAWRSLNARRPIGDAETYALGQLRLLDADVLEDDDLLKFGTKVGEFNEKLERHAVRQGWFREAPSKVVTRWTGLGVLELLGGVPALFFGFSIPFSGLVVLGGGLIAAGVVTMIVAQVMPARSRDGAVIKAMLEAYRRTLQKTMGQARSMDQVVDEAKIDWLTTPDQALVWSVALGLQDDAEHVLERSREDVQGGLASTRPYFPMWYGTSAGFAGGAGVGSGSGGSVFSASAVPDFGGMFNVLGSVGNSPSSSGGGGGGGFGGGGSGGGGGGAGGGF